MSERSVGLIGFGKWGKNLARNLSQIGVLHTICDQQLVAAPAPYNDVLTTTDDQTVWQNSIIDKVVIATPPDTHYALAKKALLAKKDVFVEKPLCLSVEEGEELVELAEEAGLILMVGHLLHFHPCIQKIKEIVFGGGIGDIRTISSIRIGSGFIRSENVLWDLVPHDVSVILSLCQNSLPVQSQCQGANCVDKEIMDNVMVTLQFENDMMAHIHASWVYPFKEQKLTIIGSEAALVFDDTSTWEDKLQFRRLKKQNSKIEYELERVEVEYQEPLLQECLHFLECCRLRKTPITNGNEALNVLKVLENIHQTLPISLC